RGESGVPVPRDQPISLLESGDGEHSWQQGNPQDLGITDIGLGVGGMASPRRPWMGFQAFLDTVIDLRQVLVYSAGHRSSSFRAESKGGFDSILPGRMDDLPVSTQD